MTLNLSPHTSFSDWPNPIWDATGGSLWGPWGCESQWASFCPLCQILLFPLHSQGLGRWELGFPPFSGMFFYSFIFLVPRTSVYLELNSEMLTAFQNPRLSEHRGLSFTPRKRAAGKGEKLVPLVTGTQWNPQALPSDILACSVSPPLVPGSKVRW